LSEKANALRTLSLTDKPFSSLFETCILQRSERTFDRLAALAFFALTENFSYEGLTRKSERFRTGYMLTWITLALFAFIARPAAAGEWRAD